MNRKTILIVDDDLLILNLVKFSLGNKNFKILEATDGEEALEILDQHEPNSISLIITDYHMPKINGLELANLLKDHEHHCNIPLILISSDTKITHTADNKYLIFKEILHKPFTSETLFNKVQKLILR